MENLFYQLNFGWLDNDDMIKISYLGDVTLYWADIKG